MAYPAHRKLSKINFEWPAVWNISWHTAFSIMGTWTSCSTDGTPPSVERDDTVNGIGCRGELFHGSELEGESEGESRIEFRRL